MIALITNCNINNVSYYRSMGGNESAEANGIEACLGCGVRLSPANPSGTLLKHAKQIRK